MQDAMIDLVHAVGVGLARYRDRLAALEAIGLDRSFAASCLRAGIRAAETALATGDVDELARVWIYMGRATSDDHAQR